MTSTSTTDRISMLRKRIADLTTLRNEIRAELNSCPTSHDGTWYTNRVMASIHLHGALRAAQDRLDLLTVADDSDSVMV